MIPIPSPTETRFPFGQVIVTEGAFEALSDSHIDAALVRHGQGDWGELDEPDLTRNEVALASTGRLVSAYSGAGIRFYVITEADRSVTTILLPHEY